MSNAIECKKKQKKDKNTSTQRHGDVKSFTHACKIHTNVYYITTGEDLPQTFKCTQTLSGEENKLYILCAT